MDDLKAYDPPADLLQPLTDESVMSLGIEFKSKLQLEYAKVLLEEERKRQLPIGLRSDFQSSENPMKKSIITQDDRLKPGLPE